MIIYIDENLPPQIAKGMDILQKPLNKRYKNDFEIKSIKEVFGQGIKDEKWIPIAGKEKAVALTQDFRIQRMRHQRDLFNQHGLGIIFFNTPKGGLSYWEFVKNFTKRWEEILKIADNEKKPFAFKFNVKSKKIEPLD